jgi:hypothetical protein
MDYRRWIAYSSGLKTLKDFRDLYSAVRYSTKENESSCELILEDSEKYFEIKNTAAEDVLKLNEADRDNFLAYLEKNYLVIDLPIQNIGEGNSVQNASSFAEEAGSTASSMKQQSLTTLFANANIWKHTLGYSVIGFLIAQIFVLPQFFNTKLPEFMKWSFIIVFSVIAYYAVKVYKNQFLIGGIRYRTVGKVTMLFYGITFTMISVETALIDSFIGQKGFDVFANSALAILVILIGVFSGWIVSFFIYYLVGGRIVTDTSKIRMRTNTE